MGHLSDYNEPEIKIVGERPSYKSTARSSFHSGDRVFWVDGEDRKGPYLISSPSDDGGYTLCELDGVTPVNDGAAVDGSDLEDA
ncbi:hypothetical protein GQ53DRAFT_531154 [Thozetella sp. PMI_491]|nr:hypothetical protein GQ53DRAFT_531154 [Thozetella sp. PMI_491]